MALLIKSSACLIVELVGLVSLLSACSDPVRYYHFCFELPKMDGKAAPNA